MREHEQKLPPNAASIAAEWIRQQSSTQPKVGIILGSGLNELLGDTEIVSSFAYRDIPYFAPTTVSGHAGKFELGQTQGQPVAILRGRFHLYEGHKPERLVLPVRMLHELGVETLIVTNAAGGLNPNYRKGDLMIMNDHIGLPTLSGANPLIGPNDDTLGPRFPAMASAYDTKLIDRVRFLAQRANMKMHEGVYVMVSGPTYETPAEMRALHRLGADAVGMSTVPEVIAARHMGMRVLGISCITNSATPETANTVSHEEVLEGAAVTMPKLDRILRDLLHSFTREEQGVSFETTAKPVCSDVLESARYGYMPDSLEDVHVRRIPLPTRKANRL